ncbi:helix-turn-helix domain-containing protein [Flavivirga sp. 57AJ16]|uniref:helix-turn-helix domain-containing protein n=1 Tax=Flavivirga sp. 57AJ16 TaxID=3025307 RepID=UPI00236692BD|nr:helix-turn-helix domain-containing protein [Flavivirga sp. 57AJ16]MDD7885124.1 helix-turn-helix domain-containing protein [Flavivirga sp. 57AJ16]
MNKFLKIVVIIIIFHCCVSGYSQITQKDSIQNYFRRIEALIDNVNQGKRKEPTKGIAHKKVAKDSDIRKVDLLLNLYTTYKYKNTKYANKCNNKALQLSLSSGYKKGALQANYNNAYQLFVNGQFDRATDLLGTINMPSNYKDYPHVYSDVICLKSLIHTERGAYDIALDMSLKLLDIGEKDNSNYTLMKAHGALLHCYLRKEDYSKALNHCLKGLDYTIKLEEVQYLYFKIDEIARLLFKLGNTKGALHAYDFYLKLENKITPPGDYIQSIVYMNMSDIYTSSNQFKKAHNHISKALELNYKNNFRFRIPRALILQAELYLKEKDTINAIDSYERSLSAAKDINAFDVVQSTSEILSDLYEKSGESLKAFEYMALHNSIKDSLFPNEKEQKFVILEAQRKIKEITQKQKILALENEAQKTKMRTIVSVLLGILALSLIVLFSYLKVKSKNKFLYTKTVELAKVQLHMRNKIEALERLSPGTDPNIDNNNDNEILDKIGFSTIDESVKNIILNKLDKLEKTLFFTDQGCTLRKLAEQLKTNPKYLSQVINQEKKSNFSNYINELRINHLLTKLLKEKDFRESKLSYIAVSVGFNNLNTFNAAFKKRQGILPSYFIKELIQESEKEIG